MTKCRPKAEHALNVKLALKERIDNPSKDWLDVISKRAIAGGSMSMEDVAHRRVYLNYPQWISKRLDVIRSVSAQDIEENELLPYAKEIEEIVNAARERDQPRPRLRPDMPEANEDIDENIVGLVDSDRSDIENDAEPLNKKTATGKRPNGYLQSMFCLWTAF